MLQTCLVPVLTGKVTAAITENKLKTDDLDGLQNYGCSYKHFQTFILAFHIFFFTITKYMEQGSALYCLLLQKLIALKVYEDQRMTLIGVTVIALFKTVTQTLDMRRIKRKKELKHQVIYEVLLHWRNVKSLITIPNHHIISPTFADGA